ncbi:hypothetical protein BGZ80_006307 [Entomortierella chlamydospora]|uniref:Uncharacterized protein n=1 Tax=Entomortierella chlamydospora TaxID=101097 RepID=A0A9P6STJ9_9FUNG|nr:hypothetical protein BGZ80_006307 [Entomortierella chlamydospora]
MTSVGGSYVGLRTFSTYGMQTISAKKGSSISFTPSRDYKPRSKAGTLSDASATDTLRRNVMDEVAIPGKYRTYFKPDKRTVRKEEESMHMSRLRSPKKVTAAKWKNSQESSDTDLYSGESEEPNSTHIRKRGFENVAWRALEQIYARDVLPHPLLHRDYLKIKLLPDRKTFQLWYTPIPDDKVSSDQIAEAVAQHAAAFRAMLARHARSSTSSRLVFQLVRKSDQRASMADIWKRLEKEVDLESESAEDKK